LARGYSLIACCNVSTPVIFRYAVVDQQKRYSLISLLQTAQQIEGAAPRALVVLLSIILKDRNQ
jgi:hypothetical protein